MNKKRLLTYRGELQMDTETWEKQEVVRLLKGAPGTQYQEADDANKAIIRDWIKSCLLYTSPSPRDRQKSRMPSSA